MNVIKNLIPPAVLVSQRGRTAFSPHSWLVVAAVQAAFGLAGRSATDPFAAIRRGKDNF